MFFFQKWSPPGSSSMEPTFAQKATYGVIKNYLDLGVQHVSLWQLSLVLVYHSHYPSVQSGVDFPLPATTREVAYSFMNLKILHILNCCHMNIKLLLDGLVAFNFTLLVYYFLSDLLRPLSPLFSLVHVQCGAHDDTKEHSDYFSAFKKAEWPITRLEACVILGN